ncbi:hypothetical protein GWI33_011618 [Rhynchophorus ferrugineus]|uniref:Protein big brother n=2 Tax=Rhynchophorus ferrugineus TaxID=354439 RepID=A0A834IBE8_RHYFE|nr:hypothetical protein GWI33_011618 [Rhynchophorus ferrugineus]
MNMHEPSLLGMIHPQFDNLAVYEQPKPRFIFKMPRVVPDQKSKFESDELFRRLSRESEVRYTGHRDRPQEERVKRFLAACQEGHTEIAFSATGTNLQLVFDPPSTGYISDNQCDFQKEQGKVSTPLSPPSAFQNGDKRRLLSPANPGRRIGIDRRDAMLFRSPRRPRVVQCV